MAAETTTATPPTPAAVPAVVKPPLSTGGRVAPIVPDNFESAYRLATVIKAAGMAPKGFTSIEQVTVAMLHGMEVGMTPMAALQSIAVVNGMPTIYGDGLLGLVQASGLLEDIIETIEHDTDGSPLYAVCRVKRIGRASWTEQSFSRAEAQRAKLWSKQGPWTEYPRRMLQMRARAWALRDAFPDVLRGLHSAEEASDTPRDITPTQPEPRRADFVPQGGGYDPEVNKEPASTITDATEVHDEVRQDDDAANGWELYDHTGETIGEYGMTEWLGTFDAQLPAPKFKRERTQYVLNNQGGARAIYADPDTPVQLRKDLADRYPELAQTADLLSGAK